MDLKTWFAWPLLDLLLQRSCRPWLVRANRKLLLRAVNDFTSCIICGAFRDSISGEPGMAHRSGRGSMMQAHSSTPLCLVFCRQQPSASVWIPALLDLISIWEAAGVSNPCPRCVLQGLQLHVLSGAFSTDHRNRCIHVHCLSKNRV